MAPRRFPPPWSVDDSDRKLGQSCFIVRDTNGQARLPMSISTMNPAAARRRTC